MDKKNNITGINRREAAMENFLKGYNCTQSVLLAFEDLLPMENRKEIICMASSFGGGMGRLREVCGSVSGMFLVAGLLYGYEGPETGQKKTELYTRIQELAHRFEEQIGSIVCRTDEYYKKRPCKELIGMAAGILEDFINGNQADA